MSRSNLEGLGREIRTKIPRDADGYIDRECPSATCGKEFKLLPGTGLTEPAPCICPYCGNSADASEFVSGKQRRFAIENAKAQVREAFQSDMRNTLGALRSRSSSGGMFSVSFELKTTPIRKPNYLHHQLETKVVCPSCDLHYSLFGKFAFCPDCGKHNSAQIFDSNLALVEKQLALAQSLEDEALKRHLIGNSLEDAVSSFDGFGRELIRVRAEARGTPKIADGFSFQSLASAEKRLQKDFGLAFIKLFDGSDYVFSTLMFHRRHVIAHKMGVIDSDYVSRSGDSNAIVGRNLEVRLDEVQRLASVLKSVAIRLDQAL